MLGTTLKDEMSLKSRGPVPLHYGSLYGIGTLNPLRVRFVLKDSSSECEAT